MKSAIPSFSLAGLATLLTFAASVSAEDWTCRQLDLTRQVTIFYPNAPAKLPCRVYYSKPTEQKIPRPLWTAVNQENFCEEKAAEFVKKLESMGWECIANSDKEHNESTAPAAYAQ